MSISSISLSNFQCFGDEVTIPFSRLTFLFGPNSAGKSAVLDAFEILRYTLHDFWGGMRGTPPSYDQIVSQGARVRSSMRATESPTGGGAVENTQNPITTISVRIVANDYVIRDSAFGRKLIHKDIRLVFGYGVAYVDHQVVVDVVVEGEFLLSIGKTENTLNIAHPLVRDMDALQSIHACLPQGNDRCVVVFANDRITFKWYGSGNYYGRDKSSKGFRFGDEPDAHDLLLIDLFDEVWSEVVYQAVFGVGWVGVTPASRQIPNDSQLAYFIESGKQLEAGHIPYSKTDADEDFDSFSLPTIGEPLFRPIAEALAATLDDYDTWTAWERYVEDDRAYCLERGEEPDPEPWDKHNFEEYVFWEDKRRFVDNVQRTLSEYLFRDVGYQIGFDHRVLMDRSNLQRILTRADDVDLPIVVGQHPILIRLFLVDAKGRKLSFGDVGSGLAYVLPVIFNVWDPKPRRVFLQQPELHLHPALQAPLGDLFIEASRNKTVIVETHSEHILLRVLKRIRQTAAGQPLADELRISPEAVSVLYFDPGPDGTTKVKRLRITPDGDFMDRWPRGFFAERDQELFDE